MKLKWKTCFRAGVTVTVLFLIIHYWTAIAAGVEIAFHAAAPLVTGLMIAYAVNILMNFFERHYFPNSKKKIVKKTRTGVCILLSYLSLLGIIALIIGLVVPELIDCVKLLIEKIPPLMQSVSVELRGNEEMTKLWSELGNVSRTGQINWKEIVTKVADWAAGGLGGAFGVVKNVVAATFSTAFTIIMSIIFSLYLLTGKERLIPQTKRVAKTYLKESIYHKINYVLHTLNECFHRRTVCGSRDPWKSVCHRDGSAAPSVQRHDRGADRIYGIDPDRRGVHRRRHRLFDDRDGFADESHYISCFPYYFTTIGRTVYLPTCGRSLDRTAGDLGAGGSDDWRKCNGDRRNAFICSPDCSGI